MATSAPAHVLVAATVALQRAKEGHEIALLLRQQLQLEHEIEELHGVVERQQPIVVQIRRRILDAA